VFHGVMDFLKKVTFLGRKYEFKWSDLNRSKVYFRKHLIEHIFFLFGNYI